MREDTFAQEKDTFEKSHAAISQIFKTFIHHIVCFFELSRKFIAQNHLHTSAHVFYFLDTFQVHSRYISIQVLKIGLKIL